MRIATNKLKDIIDFAFQELESLYEKEEIRSMILAIIEHFTDYNLMKILSQKDELKVSESELLKINFAIKDLKKEKVINPKALYYLRKYGLGDWAKERYASMSATASDCIECGACEENCRFEAISVQ